MPGVLLAIMVATSFYDFSAVSIDGQTTSMKTYEGKVVIVVNTASKCGFTPQYEGLENIYQTYKDQGLVILGFPCDQFGHQEPGNEQEIQSFCKINFGVTFPLFKKIDVNGDNAHPLYEHLKTKAPGILGLKAIKWNFTKFLVNRKGEVLKRFAPKDTPESMVAEIEKALQQSP